MKTLLLIVTVISMFFPRILRSQNQISVCETKATHLICPEKVSYLQVGDNNCIIAEIVPEHPNMVRVKALGVFDGESSLTLVSAGKVYSLFVNYADANDISYRLETFTSEKAGHVTGSILQDYLLRELSYQLLSDGRNHAYKKEKKNGIVFGLINIYLKQDLLFFELKITNKTEMGFDVESFNWWLDDKKQYKATNAQEYQFKPEYQHYNLSFIPAKTTIREVFVIPKMTIPDKKVLRIELLEKAMGNTGRKLMIEIKNEDIMSACEF
jgi:conjugative transposon TraN protein